jgi:hypothetical protein
MKEIMQNCTISGFLSLPSRFGWLQDGDVVGVIGSGEQESAGDTHNPVIEIAIFNSNHETRAGYAKLQPFAQLTNRWKAHKIVCPHSRLSVRQVPS